MNLEVAARVESFHHPAGTPAGTLEFQVSWVRLNAGGGGKLTLSVLASRDIKDDLRQEVATRIGVHHRRVLVFGV